MDRNDIREELEQERQRRRLMIRQLTPAEAKALRLAGELAAACRDLPMLHNSDWPETAHDIHNIQNRVLARPAFEDSMTSDVTYADDQK